MEITILTAKARCSPDATFSFARERNENVIHQTIESKLNLNLDLNLNFNAKEKEAAVISFRNHYLKGKMKIN